MYPYSYEFEQIEETEPEVIELQPLKETKKQVITYFDDLGNLVTLEQDLYPELFAPPVIDPPLDDDFEIPYEEHKIVIILDDLF